jgi:hypothetical protein
MKEEIIMHYSCTQKYLPKIGEHLYLQQGGKSSGYVAEVKRAYTVVNVDDNCVTVQECGYNWPVPSYYNTMPLDIHENKQGDLKQLHWSNKYGVWQDTSHGEMADYPLQAHFGEWAYYPYLD